MLAYSPFRFSEHLVAPCILPECILAPYSRCHYYSWWSGWWLAGTVTGTALIWTGCDLQRAKWFLINIYFLFTDGRPAGPVCHKAVGDVRNHTRSWIIEKFNLSLDFDTKSHRSTLEWDDSIFHLPDIWCGMRGQRMSSLPDTWQHKVMNTLLILFLPPNSDNRVQSCPAYWY